MPGSAAEGLQKKLHTINHGWGGLDGRGAKNRVALIVSTAQSHPDELSRAQAQRRIEAAINGGAHSIMGRLGTLQSEADRLSTAKVGRILAATYSAGDDISTEVLEADITDVPLVSADAIAVGYRPTTDLAEARAQSDMFREVRLAARRKVVPVIASVYSDTTGSPEIARHVRSVAVRGADAIVADFSEDNGRVADETYPHVLLYLRLDGWSDKKRLLEQAEHARNLPIAGVVVEAIPLLPDTIKAARLIEGVGSVLQGMSSEAEWTKMNSIILT